MASLVQVGEVLLSALLHFLFRYFLDHIDVKLLGLFFLMEQRLFDLVEDFVCSLFGGVDYLGRLLSLHLNLIRDCSFLVLKRRFGNSVDSVSRPCPRVLLGLDATPHNSLLFVLTGFVGLGVLYD